MEDGNKKHYFVKLRETEIVDTFKALSLENAVVKVWKKGQQEEQAENYLIKNFNDRKMYLALKPQKTLLGFIISRTTRKNLFFAWGGRNCLHLPLGHSFGKRESTGYT